MKLKKKWSQSLNTNHFSHKLLQKHVFLRRFMLFLYRLRILFFCKFTDTYIPRYIIQVCRFSCLCLHLYVFVFVDAVVMFAMNIFTNRTKYHFITAEKTMLTRKCWWFFPSFFFCNVKSAYYMQNTHIIWNNDQYGKNFLLSNKSNHFQWNKQKNIFLEMI